MQEFCKQNFEYHPNEHIIFLIKLNFYAKLCTAIRLNNLNPKKKLAFKDNTNDFLNLHCRIK